MRAQYATRAYSKQEASGRTFGQNPAELVALLFEKACSSLKTATLIPIDAADDLDLPDRLEAIEHFHKATSKAMQIVIALRGLLDMDAGGDTSSQLAETYTIIASSIWAATQSHDTQSLLTIHTALSELRDAWKTIADAESI